MSQNVKKLGIALGIPVFLAVVFAAYTLFPGASNQGYSPTQPIPFSHKLHAGTNKIDCKYCHTTTERSAHASIPTVATCLNCHSVVKTDSPHIQKIRKAYDEGRPIEWVRIHELPDFARFPHSRHVAKGVACQTCHGPVETMEKVYQFAPLTMGWCMGCHRGETTPKHVLASTYPGEKNPHGPVASVNCSVCHH